MKKPDEPVAKGSVPAAAAQDVQRWGLLSASRRISAARSASAARTQAMRDQPPPLRDTDGRRPKAKATPDVLPAGEEGTLP